MAQQIERGDIVFHRPTGETWLVLKADATHVEPGGWPPCRALVSDCEMKTKGGGLHIIRKLDAEKASK